MEVSHLHNFVWWSKGWYAPVKNITLFDVIKKILYLDGYTFVKTEHDILSILFIDFDKYNKWRIENNMQPVSIYNLYIGTYNNMNIKKIYDPDNISMFESVIYAMKEYYMDIEGKYIDWDKPVYNRKLYKFGFKSIYHKNGMTYKQLNTY